MLADRGSEFVGEPSRNRAGRDAPGLRVPDHPVDPSPHVEADLRKLRGLAGPRLATDHHDLVIADRGGDLVAAGENGQIQIERAARPIRLPPIAEGDRAIDLTGQAIDAPIQRPAGPLYRPHRVERAAKSEPIGLHRPINAAAQIVERVWANCVWANRVWANRVWVWRVRNKPDWARPVGRRGFWGIVGGIQV